MCGIVGLFDARGTRPVDRALLARMNDSQTHRGPDGDGLFAAPGIGLGHRRLAIIDLDGGAQPMFNEDGTVVVVYNGEIYNFGELAEALAAAGHRFATRCDTEVIVHAWEEWGEACVERFRGMFAFALWDSKRQTLFLARDRLGIKPLYVAELPDGHVLFASELKALLAHPAMPREIDPQALEDYFAYGYVPDPKSIYRHARKLAPGHTLAWRRGAGAPAPRRYWDAVFAPEPVTDAPALEERLIEELDRAVAMRLIAEVPLGAFLSGGVDSSAVVALMARHGEAPVNTCSIAFDHAAYDESGYAAAVAARYRTNHRVGRVDPEDFDLLDRLATLYDEPFADSSAMPTYRVCELARRSVTVALSGDGGDEVFAGYSRHRWHAEEEALKARLPRGLGRAVFGALGRAWPDLRRGPKALRLRATFRALARDAVDAYFHAVAVLPDAVRAPLFSADLRSALRGYHAREVLGAHMAAAPAADPLSRVQYADMKTYLPGDILTKVDRASMAHSLEVRVPILDHHFVQWAGTVPPGLKLRGREGKAVFKHALEPYLPSEVLYRPKMGFAVPLGAWFRGPLAERVAAATSSRALAETGLFDTGRIAALVARHRAGAADHSAALWALLMFESFLRQVHHAAPARAEAGPRAAAGVA